MPKRTLLIAFAMTAFAMLTWSRAAPALMIEPGAPTTSVPAYLTDGSYLFGITVTLSPGEFLLPIEISGAVNLQSWQFDLLFNKTVVQEVDPGDGTSGIYGAEFTSGDLTSLSFILSGFPFNSLGQVQTVAGDYPALLTGPSGDGVLAYILFNTIAEGNPGFTIGGGQQAPEPATLVLLASGLALIGSRRLARHRQRK